MARSTHLRTRAYAWVSALSLVAWPVAAAKAPKSNSNEAQARAKFRDGQRAYDLGQFEDALKAFSGAYELKPLPGFLFNIAQCHRHLNNFERASFFYKRYLALAPLGPADAAVVKDLLREMETKQAERQRAREQEAQAAAERELVRIAAAKAEAEAAEKRRSELSAKTEAEEEMQRRAAMLRLDTERKNGQSSDEKNQLVHKWWFWTGVGLVAAGAAGTGIYFATSHSSSPTLKPINGR